MQMRGLLFKNLISQDKKRGIIASCETLNQHGIHSVIRRHFIYMARQISSTQIQKPVSQVCIAKESLSKEETEKFFFKLKGSLYLSISEHLFQITYIHSLYIMVAPLIKPGRK